ncbi:MAG: phosphatase PAP2 family protein [Firmicutes bacterium]|nr:phosphatase PAP2 family protein [Bacillota bacterium]
MNTQLTGRCWICGDGVTVYQIVKNILQRPRPDVIHFLVEEDGFGFPSGHTMIGIVFLGLLALILWKEGKPKWISVLLVVWGILIGLSRIYVGVHHPTDVVGGWCMGLIILIFWSQVFRLSPNRK